MNVFEQASTNTCYQGNASAYAEFSVVQNVLATIIISLIITYAFALIVPFPY